MRDQVLTMTTTTKETIVTIKPTTKSTSYARVIDALEENGVPYTETQGTVDVSLGSSNSRGYYGDNRPAAVRDAQAAGIKLRTSYTNFNGTTWWQTVPARIVDIDETLIVRFTGTKFHSTDSAENRGRKRSAYGVDSVTDVIRLIETLNPDNQAKIAAARIEQEIIISTRQYDHYAAQLDAMVKQREERFELAVKTITAVAPTIAGLTALTVAASLDSLGLLMIDSTERIEQATEYRNRYANEISDLNARLEALRA
jgi:hypothetical protein